MNLLVNYFCSWLKNQSHIPGVNPFPETEIVEILMKLWKRHSLTTGKRGLSLLFFKKKKCHSFSCDLKRDHFFQKQNQNSLKFTWLLNLRFKALRYRAQLTDQAPGPVLCTKTQLRSLHGPEPRRYAGDNVVSDACITFPISFSCKLQLKPTELSKHLGLITANVWFPQKHLLIFKETVIPPLAQPVAIEAS